MRIDEANGVLEIGHVSWSPLMKQRSSATEAIALLLRYAFDTLGYRRCEWKCDSHNAPSRQAALRFGFRYEGNFRFAVIVKGAAGIPTGSPSPPTVGRRCVRRWRAGWARTTSMRRGGR